ncbi:hypothetical protein GIB67_012289 [Kingdonia uniflora]|uniref:AAA+ ATPase domain-containing protein n=1 Tax=Kingdonia uniflora TaxID=39325 RepID=A0A7J7N3Z9_9MAGN|nr:hypothetical protein GIB67_012289 [Kingdonia uniflora]
MGSMIATIMVIQTAIRNFLPPWLEKLIKDFFAKFITSLKPQHAIVIEEFDNGNCNDLYDAIQLYLSSKCISSPKVLKFFKHKNAPNVTKKMDSDQSFEDRFKGMKVEWSLKQVTSGKGSRGQETTQYCFKLSFHRSNKEMIHDDYIPHIMKVAEEIRYKNRQRKLYTNSVSDHLGRYWLPIPFSHPSTFESLAINPVLKSEIQEDLKRFMDRKKFYNRVGRAWKRGYLLYGPPGTGKTSLIAAIANFLEFDIYDLELTAVHSNSQLKNLLINTSSKSVIVVEDIDCSLDLSGRTKQVVNKEVKEGDPAKISLSTEKLDPALLRAGRMDKHINLSYCEIGAFKMLAKNYLDIEEHQMIKEAEEILPLVKITPADVAEIFMSCEDNEEMGLVNVFEEMKRRLSKMEDNEIVAELGSPQSLPIEDDETLDSDETVEETCPASGKSGPRLKELRNVLRGNR